MRQLQVSLWISSLIPPMGQHVGGTFAALPASLNDATFLFLFYTFRAMKAMVLERDWSDSGALCVLFVFKENPAFPKGLFLM